MVKAYSAPDVSLAVCGPDQQCVLIDRPWIYWNSATRTWPGRGAAALLSLPEKSTNKSQINWLLLSLLQYCYSSCTVLEMSHTSDCGDRSKLAFSTVLPLSIFCRPVEGRPAGRKFVALCGHFYLVS